MDLTDDAILVRYKATGMPDERISQKMGITIEEVQIRWKRLVETAQPVIDSVTGLVNQFNVLALQYQLLGESLKIIAGALHNQMTPTEIRTLVTNDPEETVRNLIKSCIMLRPFVPINPVDSLKAHQEKN